MYVFKQNNLIYKICLKHSKSVCDLLTVKIHSPDCYIILTRSLADTWVYKCITRFMITS